MLVLVQHGLSEIMRYFARDTSTADATLSLSDAYNTSYTAQPHHGFAKIPSETSDMSVTVRRHSYEGYI